MSSLSSWRGGAECYSPYWGFLEDGGIDLFCSRRASLHLHRPPSTLPPPLTRGPSPVSFATRPILADNGKSTPKWPRVRARAPVPVPVPAPAPGASMLPPAGRPAGWTDGFSSSDEKAPSHVGGETAGGRRAPSRACAAMLRVPQQRCCAQPGLRLHPPLLRLPVSWRIGPRHGAAYLSLKLSVAVLTLSEPSDERRWPDAVLLAHDVCTAMIRTHKCGLHQTHEQSSRHYVFKTSQGFKLHKGMSLVDAHSDLSRRYRL